MAEANHYTIVALYITDIITNGSYVIYNRKAQDIFEVAYHEGIKEGEYLENCISRKKHVVPVLMEVLEK